MSEKGLQGQQADGGKRVFIKTYGCQMNVYDSTRMLDALSTRGYSETKAIDNADLVILNTCHIREKASEKVYSEIGRLKKMQEATPEDQAPFKIGVAGCVAQAEGQEIINRAPAVDLVFGPQSYHKLPGLLDAVATGERVVETDFPAEDKFDHLPKAKKSTLRQRGFTAFLTVQEGCDKFCTFCVVPYTRGAEVSRPAKKIIEEAQQLADAGVREITLLGQNVNAYHGDGPGGEMWGLARLLEKLATVPGIERLRYTTSHPRDMDPALIQAHRDLPQLMPYLHLPVQSGSDTILAAMNRRHDRDAYIRLVSEIRDARSDLALSGDFIVGFPGETDRDFEDTMDLIEEVNYAQAYSFKYSPRPGTPGALLDEQVGEEVKSERLQRLQELLNRQQTEFNASKLETTMAVLLERRGREPGQLAGRSPWLQAVHVDAPDHLIGTIQSVKIVGVTKNSLSGIIKEESDAHAA